jgi:hypothetical protein
VKAWKERKASKDFVKQWARRKAIMARIVPDNEKRTHRECVKQSGHELAPPVGKSGYPNEARKIKQPGAEKNNRSNHRGLLFAPVE